MSAGGDGEHGCEGERTGERDGHHVAKVVPTFGGGYDADDHSLGEDLSGADQVFAPGTTSGQDAGQEAAVGGEDGGGDEGGERSQARRYGRRKAGCGAGASAGIARASAIVAEGASGSAALGANAGGGMMTFRL